MSENFSRPPDPRQQTHLIGHEAAERELLESWSIKRRHHAWLITGPEGIGKATLAWRFARFVLNDGMDIQNGLFGDSLDSLSINPNSSLFGKMAAGGHPDFLCLEKGMLNPKTNKIAENDIPVAIARKAVNFIRLTPAESSWRVILIDSADDLNINAANALLKALEEPPSRTLFILISHAPGRLLPTIRSRCRRLSLSPLKTDLVAGLIGRYYPEMRNAEINTLAFLGEGSIGKALALAEAGGIELYRALLSLLDDAGKMNAEYVQKFATQMSGKAADKSFRTFRLLLDWWLKRFIRGLATGHWPVELLPQEKSLYARLTAQGNLALWLAVWEKMTKLLAQSDAPVNLDKKQVIIGAFMALESALNRHKS